ncbi:hypothetical protein [Amorphus coralli]|uniref:hypothetical protein n=1 Tax=Amorphus coralli TaxID=340680 RepID=UPI0003732251|nr:hypothetical protein [Amorphus coralli]
MAADVHDLAPHHLPMFVPSADGSDPLMTIMLVALIVGLVFAGAFYLHLHSLPERLAHRHHRVQFDLVAIMALIALFTHNNIFWVAALLLAFVPIPDFFSPLQSMAASLSRMAGRGDDDGGLASGADPDVEADPHSGTRPSGATEA